MQEADSNCLTLQIEGMTCSSCSSAVESALRSQKGVVSAAVNLLAGRAEVTNPLSWPQPHTADHAERSFEVFPDWHSRNEWTMEVLPAKKLGTRMYLQNYAVGIRYHLFAVTDSLFSGISLQHLYAEWLTTALCNGLFYVPS